MSWLHVCPKTPVFLYLSLRLVSRECGACASVMLLTRGPRNEGALSIQVPFLAPTILSNASVIWNYTTVPQPGLAERAIPYPRGRVLGGSSSISTSMDTNFPIESPLIGRLIDFLAYTRSADEEFDQWAQMVGDPGWTWESLAPYYFKVRPARISAASPLLFRPILTPRMLRSVRIRAWYHRRTSMT